MPKAKANTKGGKWRVCNPSSAVTYYRTDGIKRKSVTWRKALQQLESKNNPLYGQNVGTTTSSIPDQEDTASEKQKPCRPTYKEKKIEEIKAWSILRQPIFDAIIERDAIGVNQLFCKSCNNDLKPDDIYHCIDCNPAIFQCGECMDNIHRICKLHIIEKWQTNTYIPTNNISTKSFELPNHDCHTAYYQKIMSLVDSKEAVTLVRLGFWATSPKSPRMAASLDLLEWYHFLTLEAQVSAQAFVSCLEQKQWREFKPAAELRKLLRGETLHEYRAMAHKMQTFPVPIETLHQCPSCPKEAGNMYVAMDANFGLVHKRNSGSSHGEPLISSSLFFQQSEVDSYVLAYEDSSKKGSGACSTFQAGDVLRTKNKSVNLNYTGIFASACRHEVPKKMLNIRHGERLAYPVFLLENLHLELKDKDIKLHVLYDIACVLQGHLLRKKKTDLLEACEFAIPIFHSYGHKGDCQVSLNPRRKSGFGLTDGEQLERFWSYLRLFAKITKEQTSSHRSDLLSLAALHYTKKKVDNMEKYLVEKLAKADATIQSSAQVLQELFDEYNSVDNLHIPSTNLLQIWKEEEKQVMVNKKKIQDLTRTHDHNERYCAKLADLYALRKQMLLVQGDGEVEQLTTQMFRLDSEIHTIEVKQEISPRWKEEDPKYKLGIQSIEDRKKMQFLFRMRKYCADRVYLTEARKRYSDGQMVAKRLLKSLRVATNGLKSQLKGFNSMEFSSSDSKIPNQLKMEDISSPFADCFKYLEEKLSIVDGAGSSISKVSCSIRHRVLETSSLLERANEEQSLIQSEMLNIISHHLDLHSKLSLEMNLIPNEPNLLCIGKRSLYIHKLAHLENKLSVIKSAFGDIGQDVSHLPNTNINLFLSSPVGFSESLVSDPESDDTFTDECETESDED